MIACQCGLFSMQCCHKRNKNSNEIHAALMTVMIFHNTFHGNIFKTSPANWKPYCLENKEISPDRFCCCNAILCNSCSLWIPHSKQQRVWERPIISCRQPLLRSLRVINIWGFSGPWRAGLESWKAHNGAEWESTDLRCHPMTEVHDGNVFSVRSLVQTQVVFQTVLQLGGARKEKLKN